VVNPRGEVSPHSPAPFRTTRIVEFHDTDMAGIMHFASFFLYMESAEHELLRSLGLSVHPRGLAETISFPRVQVSCDFRSPAHCEDVLEIEIFVERLGKKSITYLVRMTAQQRLVAEGRVVCACCLVQPGKPLKSVPLPAEIAAKLQTYALPGSGAAGAARAADGAGTS
jgi:4-hydroxybenzoyl-CoA thioesterase/acyl-CoA thioester hydrolase